MMRMSTRGRYGLRAMMELALRHGQPPARLKDVAQTQEIPLAYLRELMMTLAAAGLVRPVRGPRGGYVLTRDPAQITVLEIVEPLEGPLVIVDCTANPEVCNRAQECPARRFWGALAGQMAELFRDTSLLALANGEAKLP